MYERRGELLHVPLAVGDGDEIVGDGSEWIGLDDPDRDAWEAYLAESARLEQVETAPDGAEHTDPAAFPTSHQTGLAKTDGGSDD